METVLTSMGYALPRDKIPPHFMEKIKRDLVVKPLENPNFTEYSGNKSFAVYRQSKTKIYLPKYYGLTEFGIPQKDTLPPGESIEVTFNGALREIQQTVIDETVKSNYNGLLNISTGMGKTVMALKLVELLKKKTLIIVHAEFLLDQWVERIKEYLPGARIGVIRQDRCEWESKDIVVGMIQSITQRDYPKECFKSFGFMVVDEVHHVSSRTFSSIFFKIQTKHMIGLSATPERKDGLTKVIHWFIGPEIVNIKRETGKPSIKFVFADCKEYIEKRNKMEKPNGPLMITDLTVVPKRNKLIYSLVQELLLESRKILILTERRAHCENIKNYLVNIGIDAGVYLGGMKTSARSDSIEKDVIIGTYQASGEGFDVPKLDTLILATPKSDVEQAVGRILRQKNQNEPVVVDIVDQFSIFNGQYYKRKKYYKKSEFKLIT